jgi:ubiquinone/menaquinone biosynthesis C-methylase UbiE
MNIRDRVKRLASRVRSRLAGEPPSIAMWRERAEVLSARAVFNAGHSDAELADVTEMQRRELYPRLRTLLNGQEKLTLDFGCGTGRFSRDLADMLGGQVVAIDPVQRLLDLAPPHPRVEYRLMRAGRIPLADGVADLIWICLVLGGVPEDLFDQTVRELDRVLKPGGLVFMVENTTDGKGSSFWKFRSVADYQRVLPNVPLSHLGDYTDLAERISIFGGRKMSPV